MFLVVLSTILYVECSVYYPEKINLLSGEKIENRKGFAYTVETSGAIETVGSYDATVKLFGLIPVKEVNVNVMPELELTAGGKSVGIKMFTKGLMCVGSQTLKDTDGVSYNTARALNIKMSDMILSANGTELHTIEEFQKIIKD